MLNPRLFEGSDGIYAGFNKVESFPFLEKSNQMN